MEYKYKAQVFKPIKMAIIYLLSYLGLIFLLILMAVEFRAMYLHVIGFCILMLLPLLYAKKARAGFMWDVEVIFDSQAMHIKTYRRKRQAVLKEEQYEWRNLEACKVYFMQSGYVVIGLYLKGRLLGKEICFVDKPQDEAVVEVSIYNLFLTYCFYYNASNGDAPIKHRRGFLTTTWGTFLLYFILIGSLVMMILYLIYKPRSFPTTLISIGFLVTLFAKRSSDKTRYKSMKAYKPIDILKENLESKDAENDVDD